MKWIVAVVIFSWALVSCTPESEEVQQLRQQITQVKAELKRLEKQNEQLFQELREAWQRSLKYRFPQIKRISDAETSLALEEQNIGYLQTIRFKGPKSDSSIQAILTFRTKQANVKPTFYIYLFDDKGVNIHKRKIVYTSWGIRRSLPVGKVVQKKYTLSYQNHAAPKFFLIKQGD